MTVDKVSHDPLLTAEEAADYLKLSEGTIRNMAASGRLPKTKLGTSLRFRLSDLNRYIAERSTPEAVA